MRSYRMSRDETAHYTSLEELRKAWKLKPVVKQTKDKEKLNKRKENFVKRHICPACKKPMTYTGGNLMVCQNEVCKGVKHKMTLESGEEKVWYTPSFDLLDEKGSEIANNIFTE